MTTEQIEGPREAKADAKEEIDLLMAKCKEEIQQQVKQLIAKFLYAKREALN